MARYRAPLPPSSAYITPQGAETLKQELDYLWRKKRPEVTQAVSEAAALGDRSENAEYIYGKKQLREIDRRVRFLRKRLEKLVIVDHPPENQGRIYFGAWIELEKEDGARVNYRIVGPDEFDLKRGWISMDSPLAKALIGKATGDEVWVTLPSGEECFYIEAVQYSDPAQTESP
ncbi:transcription elongation factor GreB [Aestuariirhabdus litorea]|uniref:Transcription elongation factor GreB n=1 Tax=Aestuariirhabdus litorea TaxID=2528527 RepID=A0A3P3VQZ5_9GAMM|nr:transcription elongation factor GreB [Aestuariirhabdus litorea]RRJ84874.1 transcription elongation factor GreB [Aestuariirhabdus litorea]RWW98100.1 transcription elongation factor GreB [Endozoicomonadaceae bacterium GTF-13]